MSYIKEKKQFIYKSYVENLLQYERLKQFTCVNNDLCPEIQMRGKCTMEWLTF